MFILRVVGGYGGNEVGVGVVILLFFLRVVVLVGSNFMVVKLALRK